MKVDAMFYENKGDYLVCNLCPNNCIFKDESFGICTVRVKEKSKLKSINYGEVSSIGLDPIEKKPLFHYKPQKYVLSVGSFGCNFKCGFCQNYSISMGKPKTEYISAQSLVDLAENLKDRGNIGIAFTYNEPTIWYEYIFDVCKIAKEKSIDIILVTNGYINKKPLENLLPFVHAMNIDLKSFNKNFYKNICKGRIENVLETIETASKKCHVEITTLLISGYNDSKEEIRELCKWLSSIDKDIPLHLTRYYPMYKFDVPATDINKILECKNIAKEYLTYVYTGNINIKENTYCPNCGNLLIERQGYNIKLSMKDDICPKCGSKINVVL